jgi:diguanylate cyclase (GGDEF)-like protein
MRILLAEDSLIYQKLIGDYVREWGFDLTITNNGGDAWQILRQPGGPRLVMLDWVLPDFDGVDICRKIRKLKHDEPYTYTVLITGRKDKQDPVIAMEAGADDFLVKPFEAIDLKARLFAGKRILELQEQLLAAQESLRFAATHDSLTGVWNRAGILEFLTRELARAKREQTAVAVALIDIDHFKSINDSIGHVAGDSVLREVGRLLASKVRDYDGAGRYGGEEFLLVIPGCDLQTMRSRAEEVRVAVSKARFDAIGPQTMTVSIGVISAFADPGVTAEDLLHRADSALYKAKHSGRNRVEIADAANGSENCGVSLERRDTAAQVAAGQ